MRAIWLGMTLLACSPEPAAPAAGTSARIVAIGPGTEANLAALGLADALVGVSDFCTIDAERTVPRVGGQTNPNLERIATLAPQLVLVQGAHPRVAAWCRSAGVEFRAFTTDSIAGWRDEVRWLGERFAKTAESEALLAGFDRALEELQSDAPPRRTLLVVARRDGQASGILAAGAATYLSSLLAAAGGSNVLPPGAVAYPNVNEETLIRLDPEAVIEFRPGTEDAGDADALAVWRRSFPDLTAVREGRVGVVRHPEALIPGPRMHEVARAMHALLR